ncbi:MAG: type I restriction-modification system subunit M N-terminal domain-containing protein [Candidatus Auribacterota bacterium]|nr:type I restriction-modification system subunit M N-terminal domain-containing protein [Candidatus Auribacterota bacterium]
MLVQELRSKIDKLRDLFRAGGIANPMAVIEQISYLIFMKRLEDMDIVHQHGAERRDEEYISIFQGEDEDCRWSSWINMPGEEMLVHVRDKVFPFIKNLKGEDSLYSRAILPRKCIISARTAVMSGSELSSFSESRISVKEQRADPVFFIRQTNFQPVSLY